MKKGELKKKEILKTAEALFCKNGYESTSIQDILDELHTSKGSFYHHFESKEFLLESMCAGKAQAAFQQVVQCAAQYPDSLRQLNCLLGSLIPLRDDSLSFLLMILPVFSTQSGRSIRTAYCSALSSLYIDALENQLAVCVREKNAVIYDCRATAEICLTVMNHFWCGLCDRIIEAAETGDDAPDFTRLIDQYRIAIERIISAPYGSLNLIELPDLLLLSTQIRIHWKK